MKQKLVLLGSMGLAILLAGLALIACAPAERTEEVYLSIGSTSITSSMYPQAVALAKIINENIEGVTGSIVETGATWDNVRRIEAGELNLAAVCSLRGSCQAYNGWGPAEGNPYPDLRVLFFYSKAASYFVTLEESGIKDVMELEGRKFNPGIAGSSDESDCRQICKTLGVEPDWYLGSSTDAAAAMKDRRIEGYFKAGSGLQLDATMLDILSLQPIDIVSLTEEQAEKVKAADPTFPFTVVPAGEIKAMPQLPDIRTRASQVLALTSKDLPDYVAYGAVKYSHLRWNEVWIPCYVGCRGVKPLEETISLLAEYDNPCPLHAGVVKYLKEVGLEVPDRLIPPEYKG